MNLGAQQLRGDWCLSVVTVGGNSGTPAAPGKKISAGVSDELRDSISVRYNVVHTLAAGAEELARRVLCCPSGYGK